MSDSNTIKIQQVLSEQFNKYRYIFWYDEDGVMDKLVAELNIEGVKILTLDNNPFSIKYSIISGEQPERGFLIYSKDKEPNIEDNWLLDLQLEGTIFSADMASLYAAECNIPLELKSRIVDCHLEFFKTQSNRTKLSERVRPGMSQSDIINELLVVTTGAALPTYDQLTYSLADEYIHGSSAIYDKLGNYNLLENFWDKIEQAFGYHHGHSVKDLVLVLFKDEVSAILDQGELTNEAHIFMHDWRDSRQYGAMYKMWAEQLEKELGIMHLLDQEPIEHLVRIETYPCIDKIIAQYISREVLHETMTTDRVEEIVDGRRNRIFFSVAQHTIVALLEARRLFEDVKKKMSGLKITSAEQCFKLYVNDLYIIDQHYRHFFKEANLSENRKLLGPVITKVERVYTNSYLSELAKKWQPILDGMEKWEIDKIHSQRQFYQYNVAPFVAKKNRIFVIISDALRYETMKELQLKIAQENRMEATMKTPMLSTLPSYTQLGMASLLPHRELSYEKETDEVFADGNSTMGTENRSKVLQLTVPRSIAIKADEFMAINNGREWVKDYDLIYIYSNTIDKVGDSLSTETNVFKATEDEMDRIVRMVKFISSSNGSNIIITSDHGYIYQNEILDDTDFIDFKAQGGTCFIENRRFVIGKDLLDGIGVKTWKSENVGVKSGVDIQICNGIGRIRKQGSGTRFIHGGSMPQEVVVPLLHVNIKKVTDISYVDVDILGKQSRITTTNQSIKFYQTEAVSEKVKETTLKLGFYTAQGEIISDSVTLTFDSQSNDSTMREQKHTFRFKSIISKLNGQTVILRMERQIENSEQFAMYKEEEYKVSVMFEAEW